MKKSIVLIAGACAVLAASSAHAACLSDAEIEASVGDQIRAKALFITAPNLVGRPLCSGITLAQQMQHMREVAFPEERAARQRQEAEQQRLQAAEAADASAAAQAANAESAADDAAADAMFSTDGADGAVCGPDDDAVTCNESAAQ